MALFIFQLFASTLMKASANVKAACENAVFEKWQAVSVNEIKSDT